MTEIFTIGLIGARGHTGRELLRLIAGHPHLSLGFAASRELAGRPVSDVAPEISTGEFEFLDGDEAAARKCDVCVLAMPDGAAAPYVDGFSRTDTILIDLSADYRFDKAWKYGLPELYRTREQLGTAGNIANPGCYATATQLAIHPALDLLVPGQIPSVFGISGYSGAGTKPSPRNDVALLADNLMPYALTGHKHEMEISHHLGRAVYFTPHVHPAFSGLLVTMHLPFKQKQTSDGLFQIYTAGYRHEPLITVQQQPPTLKNGTGIKGVMIGGFSVSADGLHGVIVAAEDNLQKGAAVQAVQNINLALGLDELAGIL